MDFIAQREGTNVAPSLSLWREHKAAGGRTWYRMLQPHVGHDTNARNSYRHVLTGATRPHRDEAKSGIIADEMGLGKTLVILSTIAGSVKIGTDFASNHAKNMPTPCKIQHHASRATLIIAPSTRKGPSNVSGNRFRLIMCSIDR